MVEIKTRFGMCYIESTGCDYQVVMFFSRLSELTKELDLFLDNLGKYESIVDGLSNLSNDIGISQGAERNKFSHDDTIISKVGPTRAGDKRGCLDIYIQTRELTNLEQRVAGVSRYSIRPEEVGLMVENVEKYEKLKISWDHLKELINGG